MNADKPHIAIMNISFMVYEMDSTGQPTGQTIGRHAVMKSGVRPKILPIIGESYQDCLNKLKEKIDGIV
jgi:hypothetical protein